MFNGKNSFTHWGQLTMQIRKISHRLIMISVLCAIQWLLIQTVHAAPLSLEDTRHLVHRSGFGESPTHIIEASQQTRDELINTILSNTQPASIEPKPAWANTPLRARPDHSKSSDQERRQKNQAIGKLERRRGGDLKHWWLSSLITTPNPLQAKMILFWQNHFTSSQRKVRHAQLMVRQFEILEKEATGNFSAMLKSMLKDPAMLIYLDNRSNRKNKPNENLARELLELFTLGEGHYSEQDIKEAARALTGYAVNNKFEFVFRKKHHDNGEKNILGNIARHDATSLADVLLEHPATAKNIVTKLWHYFVSDDVSAPDIDRLARIFRDNNYEIKPVLEALFKTPAFWSPDNRATLIRSPADFIASTLRAAQMPAIERRVLLTATRKMGQQLFYPPNVKGWQQGHYWINAQTLLARNSFAVMATRNPRRLMQSSTAENGSGATDMQEMTMTMTETKPANMMAEKGKSEMVHLIDAPSHLTDTQVRVALISTSIPVNQTNATNHSRIGRFILDPAWNLY